MLRKTIAILVISISLSANVARSNEVTCDEALDACDLYVEVLEKENDQQAELIKAQATKIELQEKQQQNWLFVCPSKLACLLIGAAAGALVWEVAR